VVALDLLVRDGHRVGGRLPMLEAVDRQFRGRIFDLVQVETLSTNNSVDASLTWSTVETPSTNNSVDASLTWSTVETYDFKE
jgi:hypothetical protein